MDVFISYAHEDSAFVGRLSRALVERGHEPWVDTEDIEPADRWRGSAQGGIERSEAFVFVLSGAALRSSACLEELTHAASVNKRVIAVCIDEAVADAPKPATLDELSWIMMRPDDEFARGIELLVHALETDLELVREHTRLLVRAKAWELGERRASPLLRGDELSAAEEWLSRSALGGGPEPTELQREFVVASRRAATRRQRNVAGISMAVAVLALALSAFALVQRSDAISNEKVAQSRQLAAEAEQNVSSDAALGAALALRALAIRDTTQAAQALRDTLSNLQQLVVFKGDTEGLTTAVYSPDGSRVLTASNDGTARVWNARTGAQLLELRTGGAINAAAFGPTGSRIVTADADGTARVFDARSGRQLLVIHTGRLPVNSAAFSPDGSTIAVGSFAGASVWSAITGSRVLALPATAGEVSGVAFSRNGSEIVGVVNHGSVEVWSARTGAPLAAVKLSALHTEAASLSPDGAEVAVASLRAGIWSLRTGRRLLTLSDRGVAVSPETVAFNRNGTELVTDNGDQVEVWNAQTGRELNVLGSSTSGLDDAEFSPDGSRIVTASLDHTAAIWDAASLSQLLEMDVPNGGDGASFSPDGSSFVTTGFDGTTVWNAATNQPVWTLSKTQGSGSAQFGDHGSRLVTVGGQGDVRIWDVRTHRRLLLLRGPVPFLDAALSPDGSEVLTTTGSQLTAWDARDGRQLFQLDFSTFTVAGAAFSADGSRIVTADGDGTARIYDARTGALQLTLRGDPSGVQSAAFSADGRRIVTASADGTARIWNALTGRELAVLQGDAGTVDDAAFSPNGSLVATAGADGTMRVWNAQTGVQLLEFQLGSEDEPNSVEFSPSGSEILVGTTLGVALYSTVLAGPIPALERLARSLLTQPLTAAQRATYLAGIS